MQHTPALRTLDVSFTEVRGFTSMNNLKDWPDLCKISVTSCPLKSLEWIRSDTIPNIQTLNLGAIAENGSLTLRGPVFHERVEEMKKLDHLENLSLVGNTKLDGGGCLSLELFISEVGRRCKVRHLTSYLPKNGISISRDLAVHHVLYLRSVSG